MFAQTIDGLLVRRLSAGVPEGVLQCFPDPVDIATSCRVKFDFFCGISAEIS